MPPKALEMLKMANAVGQIMRTQSSKVSSGNAQQSPLKDDSKTVDDGLTTASPGSGEILLDETLAKRLRLSFDEVQQGLRPLYNWQYLDCDRGPLRDAFNRLAEDEQRVRAKLEAMEDVACAYPFKEEELFGELERLRNSAADEQLKLYLDDPQQVDEVVEKMQKMLLKKSDEQGKAEPTRESCEGLH